ncbi:hypothetical protein [Palleronia abyssalis]|uniref:Uncharacterized protein n=1 Tax=Palleronia abyssalis TaxID=1501240 RepID=A0A2R8BZ09_9RHOB|nr:hypothetical protein [Palleronia abyssalis]SPJ25372.1 hypothetical protein PAA8504_03223 [Palleronia abyssalis]
MSSVLTRRTFLKSTACTSLSLGSLAYSARPAIAGVGLMTAWMELCKVIVDATGKPFRAKAQGQPAADPMMVALRENRRLLASTNRKLDAVSDMVTALMVNHSILPQKIDQVVASRISGMVPQIVRSELGQFREEQNAANLMAAITTFTEEVELDRPRAQLETRLADIREYRNRVRAGPNFSILTLCASMDSELAAMRILDYSKAEAEVVGRVYLEEFRFALDASQSSSLVAMARQLDNDIGQQLAATFGPASNMRGDYRIVLGGEQHLCSLSPSVMITDETYRVAESLPNQYKTNESGEVQILSSSYSPNRFYNWVMDVEDNSISTWVADCERRPFEECGESGSELPHSGCAGSGRAAKDRATQIYNAIVSGHENKIERFNAYQALRGGLWESLTTTYHTGRRLLNEVASWET